MYIYISNVYQTHTFDISKYIQDVQDIQNIYKYQAAAGPAQGAARAWAGLGLGQGRLPLAIVYLSHFSCISSISCISWIYLDIFEHIFS